MDITSDTVGAIDLVLTFAPLSPVGSGVLRVAALQTVYSEVRINFNSQATLYWLVSALKAGDVSPNQAGLLFTSNADDFRLVVNEQIIVTHDPGGWNLPHYDGNEWSVNVGFGLRIGDWVYWGYSVGCTSGQHGVLVEAGAYELVRSDGAEKIGDPVVLAGMSQWSMPLGHHYSLHFDSQGTGVLRVI